MDQVNVFESWPVEESASVVLPVGTVRLMNEAFDESWASWWGEPALSLVGGSDGVPAEWVGAPYPNAGGQVLVFSPEVLASVEPVLGEYGEFLPFAGSDYRAFHCMTVRDFVDVTASEGLCWGSDEKGDYVWMHERLAFASDARGVFTVPQLRGSQMFFGADVAAVLEPLFSAVGGTRLVEAR